MIRALFAHFFATFSQNSPINRSMLGSRRTYFGAWSTHNYKIFLQNTFFDKTNIRRVIAQVSQGELWRVYIVKRGYIREPGWRLFLCRPHHVLQATSPCVKKSRPQQHMWNSKGFVLSRSNLLLHYSLDYQHLMKTKGWEFQDTYSKDEAFVSIVHINS